MKFSILLVGFLLCLGMTVRYIFLDQHFSHVDDLGVAKAILETKEELNSPQKFQEFLQFKKSKIYDVHHKNYGQLKYKLQRFLDQIHLLDFYHRVKFQSNYFLVIPQRWTYAPFQYFLTPLLISPDLDYQQILFWGRLPSLLFNVLALILFSVFCYSFFHKISFAVIGVSLLIFSWENIIYSQQMSSYALGVLASIILLFFLNHYLQNSHQRTKKYYIKMGLGVGLLPFLQYQMILFIPAYFITVALFDYKNAKFNIKNQLWGLGSCALMTIILFYYFLRFHTHRSLNWNTGPQKEFLFSFAANFPEKVLFFFKNFPIVLGANLSMISEESPFYSLQVTCFVLFFLLGIVSIIKSPHEKVKSLGLFFLTLAFTWVVFILLQKITLSPTRHSLILLPAMCTMISLGFHFVVEKFTKKVELISAATAMILTLFFLINFPHFKKQRQDPFVENKIFPILSQYQVEKIYCEPNTFNLFFMRQVSKNFPILLKLEKFQGQRIAYIGHRDKLATSPTGYQLLYKQELHSNIEIDFSSLTKNGSNNFYFYILQSIDKKSDGR